MSEIRASSDFRLLLVHISQKQTEKCFSWFQVITEKIEERRQKLERRGAVKRNSLVMGGTNGQIGSANAQNGGTNGAQFHDLTQAAPPPSSTG